MQVWTASGEPGAWQQAQTIAHAGLRGVPINCLALHPLGTRLLVHARDNLVRIFDLRTNAFLAELAGAQNEVSLYLFKSSNASILFFFFGCCN